MQSLNKVSHKLFNREAVNKDDIDELLNQKINLMDIVSLSNKVTTLYHKDYHLCTIFNAKSGACAENCRYCAQSSHHKAEIDVYDMKSIDEIIKAADECYKTGIQNFGIVTSGRGYKSTDTDFITIIEAIVHIKNKYNNMNICASLGLLDDNAVKSLKDAGLKHYNINLQVNTKTYDKYVATTHTIKERIDTIKRLKKHGISICSGGIIGLGETFNDRIEMAFELRDLDVDVIPLNVLIPVKGTPLEKNKPLSLDEVVKTFAIFRLINPDKIIKFAAGRETVMKDFQGLVIKAGANGFLTGGYLTVRGRDVADDLRMLEQLKSIV